MKWPEFKLSNLTAKFISGGTPNTKIEHYWNGDIPWITGADFTDGEIILGRRHINQDAITNSAANIVPKGSIIMVTRTGVGKIAIAQKDTAISQDITGIVLKDGVNTHYVIAAIKNKMSILLSAQRGATIKGITRQDISSLVLALPPITEQWRIVEILDQADRLRKLRAEADKKAERILPALFIKMFGDPATNPMGWETAPFEKLVEIGTQLVDPKREEYQHLPHIGGEHIESNTGRILPHETVANCKLRSNKFLFSSRHILFSKIRPYLNKVAFPQFEGLCSADIYPLIPKDDQITPWYLIVLLRSQTFLDYARVHSDRLRIPKLNKIQLGAFETPIPGRDVLAKFEQQAKKIVTLGNSWQTRTTGIEKIFSVILHRAFTGDLTASWRQAHMKELLQEMELQAKALRIEV